MARESTGHLSSYAKAEKVASTSNSKLPNGYLEAPLSSSSLCYLVMLCYLVLLSCYAILLCYLVMVCYLALYLSIPTTTFQQSCLFCCWTEVLEQHSDIHTICIHLGLIQVQTQNVHTISRGHFFDM